MTKRYYSKRYVRKRRPKRTKYLITGLILMFITLVVVSAYSDIPQLEPIRKQIESFKRGIGGSELLVGETGERGGIAITVRDCRLVDSYYRCWSPQWSGPGVHEISGGEIALPPKGAKFLFIYIKAENVGKAKKTFPKWNPHTPQFISDISLYYAGASMDKHAMFDYSHPTYGKYPRLATEPLTPLYCCAPLLKGCTCERYPGETVEGWIGFEVPEGIEPAETTLEINGLVWKFWSEPTIVPG
jgi:hypothetical protein